MQKVEIENFRIVIKGGMHLFCATIKVTNPNKSVDEEDIVLAITGGSIKRSGIISALTNRALEVRARRETRKKHALFADWLLKEKIKPGFKKHIAKARRAKKAELE